MYKAPSFPSFGYHIEHPEVLIVIALVVWAMVFYFYFTTYRGKTLRDVKKDLSSELRREKEVGYIRRTALPPEPGGKPQIAFAILSLIIFVIIVFLINPSACNQIIK